MWVIARVARSVSRKWHAFTYFSPSYILWRLRRENQPWVMVHHHGGFDLVALTLLLVHKRESHVIYYGHRSQIENSETKVRVIFTQSSCHAIMRRL